MPYDAAHRQQQTGSASPALHREKTTRFLTQAEVICRANGARMTPIRRRVLEVLHVAAKPLGAYDLAGVLASAGRRMAPITVYRALDFLMEQGLAHRLASQNAYIAATGGSDSRETKAFLICEACSSVEEATSSGLAESLSDLLKGQGFQPGARILEVTGRCTRCQGIH